MYPGLSYQNLSPQENSHLVILLPLLSLYCLLHTTARWSFKSVDNIILILCPLSSSGFSSHRVKTKLILLWQKILILTKYSFTHPHFPESLQLGQTINLVFTSRSGGEVRCITFRLGQVKAPVWLSALSSFTRSTEEFSLQWLSHKMEIAYNQVMFSGSWPGEKLDLQ